MPEGKPTRSPARTPSATRPTPTRMSLHRRLPPRLALILTSLALLTATALPASASAAPGSWGKTLATSTNPVALGHVGRLRFDQITIKRSLTRDAFKRYTYHVGFSLNVGLTDQSWWIFKVTCTIAGQGGITYSDLARDVWPTNNQSDVTPVQKTPPTLTISAAENGTGASLTYPFGQQVSFVTTSAIDIQVDNNTANASTWYETMKTKSIRYDQYRMFATFKGKANDPAWTGTIFCFAWAHSSDNGAVGYANTLLTPGW